VPYVNNGKLLEVGISLMTLLQENSSSNRICKRSQLVSLIGSVEYRYTLVMQKAAALRKEPLIYILTLALLVKCIYLFFFLPYSSSAAHLSIDGLYHYNWAVKILEGRLLAGAPYFRAPFYPYFLALLFMITGKSLLFVRLVQILGGVTIIALIYVLARRFSGVPAAILAALFAIFYPITTFFEGELLLDWLFTLLGLVSFLFLTRSSSRPQHPFWGGLFFGLAAVTRPTILALLPIAIIAVALGQNAKPVRFARLRPLGALLCGVFLVVLPVTVINYATSDSFILISYQGGINFYIGNNDNADGLSSRLPGYGGDWTLQDASYIAEKETGKKLSAASESYYWYRKGFQFISKNPGRALELFGKKLYFVFSGHEISNNQSLAEVVFDNRFLGTLPVRLPFILGFALLPILLSRENRRYLLTMYGVVIIYGVTIALFFVTSRFRLTLIPLLCILAGSGVVALFRAVLARQFTYRLFFAVAAGVAMFVFAQSDIYAMVMQAPQQALYLRGNAALRAGNYQLAVARFESLTTAGKYVENSYLNMGNAFLKLGQADSAEAAFRRELQNRPSSERALNNIGVILLLRDRDDSALTYFREALELTPYYREAAINYMRAAEKIKADSTLKEIEEFRHHFRPYVLDYPGYLFEEALYLTGQGRYGDAISDQQQVIMLLDRQSRDVSFDIPFSRSATYESENLRALANYQLGYLYGLTGQFESSVRFSSKAIVLDPNLRQAYINLITGYKSLGDWGKADSVARVYQSKWP
jgi:tetratricopeptide (TPR) repeat protein